jgi:hypothetical protein
MILPTKAYDFHAHLREGYIIPMQNGKIQNEDLKVTNTYDQQEHPIDLHINPICNVARTDCSASGRYINDDGVTLEMEGNTNFYEFALTQTDIDGPSVISTVLTLDVTHKMNATNHTMGVVNMNDAVNSIQIYNSISLLGQPANWTVSATMLDNSTYTFPEPAMNDDASDTLVFMNPTPGNMTLSLPQIQSFSLTKSTPV